MTLTILKTVCIEIEILTDLINCTYINDFIFKVIIIFISNFTKYFFKKSSSKYHILYIYI